MKRKPSRLKAGAHQLVERVVAAYVLTHGQQAAVAAADIPDAAYLSDLQTYVDLFNREFRKQVRRVSPEALEALARYPWPGNVRELRNAVERAMLLADGDELGPETFPVIAGRRAISQGVELPAGAQITAHSRVAPFWLTLTTKDGKPLLARVDRSGEALKLSTFPIDWVKGSIMSFHLHAGGGPRGGEGGGLESIGGATRRRRPRSRSRRRAARRSPGSSGPRLFARRRATCRHRDREGARAAGACTPAVGHAAEVVAEPGDAGD